MRITARLLLAPFLSAAAGAQELPIQFVENAGQWDDRILFRAETPRYTMECEDRAVLLRLPTERSETLESGVALRLILEGAPTSCTPVGDGLLPTKRHFLRGDDAELWRTGVRAFASVRYPDWRPGAGFVVRHSPTGLRYDLEFDPGAGLDDLVIRCEGAVGISLDEDGSLLIETAAGVVHQSAPVSWQEHPDGTRESVAVAFRPIDDCRYGFEAQRRDPALPLVVDPALEWSTFLGGTGIELAWATRVDSNGEVLVAGSTFSPDFPATPGAYQTVLSGEGDAFVARFLADGSAPVWITLLGGERWDEIHAMDLDSQGNIAVSGITDSTAFPTVGLGFGLTDPQPGVDGDDAFVTKLLPAGDGLLWSKYLGAEEMDQTWALAVDEQDRVVVAGVTESFAFPVVGTGDPYSGGDGDAFVARISADGSTLEMSACVGGTGSSAQEVADAVAVEPGGSIVLAGTTPSADFPGILNTQLRGRMDAFVARVDGSGSVLEANYLGGSLDEEALELSLDSAGRILVGGWTDSANFPTTANAFDRVYDGGFPGDGDGFLVRMSPGLDTLEYSTFFGGRGQDEILAMSLLDGGDVVIGGVTGSIDFPATDGAWDTVFNGPDDGFDAFVARLDIEQADPADQLVYASFLGGDADDFCFAVAGDGADHVIVSGSSLSPSFPVRLTSWDPDFNGALDVTLSRIELLPVLVLSQTSLIRGQQATYTVTGADPSESVTWLYSASGAGFGPAIGALGGLNLDLLLPISLTGSTQADGGGTAVLTVTVPNNAPLIPVWSQAVVVRGASGADSIKSNTTVEVVQ